MPWTPKSFAERHNRKLRGVPAAKAAEMASAMVKSGVPEGVAIAAANKKGDAMQRKPRMRDFYDQKKHS